MMTHSTQNKAKHNKTKLIVFISGNGSNLQAIIDAIEAGRLPATLIAVISNKTNAYGLERAKAANIPHFVLPSTDYPTRNDYDRALIQLLTDYALDPDWIVLAGFMRILSEPFIQHFSGRIINIHPSLLPKYKGLNTHSRVLDNQDTQHGCSVHRVTSSLDDGPLLSQAYFDVPQNTTEADLTQAVHKLEHQLYPLTLAALLLTTNALTTNATTSAVTLTTHASWLDKIQQSAKSAIDSNTLTKCYDEWYQSSADLNS